MSSLSVHCQTVGNYYTDCSKGHFFQELLGDIEYNDIGEIIGAKAVGKQKQKHKIKLIFYYYHSYSYKNVNYINTMINNLKRKRKIQIYSISLFQEVFIFV